MSLTGRMDVASSFAEHPPLLNHLKTALGTQYTVQNQVGEGALGVVFRAEDLHGRQVVIKVLRPYLVGSAGVELLLRELAVLAKLSHPNILQILSFGPLDATVYYVAPYIEQGSLHQLLLTEGRLHYERVLRVARDIAEAQEIGITAVLTHPLIIPLLDSGDADGDLFYVMPYLPGVSVREKLERDHRMAIAEVQKITIDIAGALDYAHRSGVVHRDIKPENILLYESLAMISDFGIALALDRASRLTREGSPGTPAYMSPEQLWEPELVDHRSDVYSLACVVFEMLSGDPPYTGRSDRELAAKHLNAPIPHVSSQRAEVSAAMNLAICRALAKSPAQRFQNVREFAAALT